MKAISVGILWGILGAACAAELFVSPDGKDGNPGTREAPFATIRRAADKAAPGDTVRILPGVYRRTVTVRKSGTAEKPISFVGTRGENGEFLSIVEAEGQLLTDWTPAPEIGPGVWSVPLKERPTLVLMDGKMIALINKSTMALPRREKLPDKITEDMIWGPFGKNSKRLAGKDLLALDKDILLSHRYFRKREENFFAALNHVLSGWADGKLYVRFADGGKPEDHEFTACGENGIVLQNASYIRLSDLCVRGSRVQVALRGKSSHDIIENSLLMNGGVRILIDRDASYATVRNCILTAGFVQDKYFQLRKTDDMRGGVIYLVFKYIIGFNHSDDTGILCHGAHAEIYDNLFVRGLIGIYAQGPDIRFYHNCVRDMASVGILTGGQVSGDFYENLVSNCGIPLRIHDWRHVKYKRLERHYRNLFVQDPHGGNLVHIYGASHKVGPDQVNFEPGTDKYKENPPEPFDPGEVYLYHNTFAGGTENLNPFPVRVYAQRFREPMPFYFVNNIIRTHHSYDLASQTLLAGNLLYGSKLKHIAGPKDPGVLEVNRAASDEQSDAIWRGPHAGWFFDALPGDGSPALECGVDVSRPFTVNGREFPAFPGFAPGYFAGKAPAAGALQPGDGELLERFGKMNDRMEKTITMLENQKR